VVKAWLRCGTNLLDKQRFRSLAVNYSEVLGNATAVAISDAYYVNNRTAADNASKLGMQLAVDMAANVLKEFWPGLERKFKRKH
jgi:hypothetical protein